MSYIREESNEPDYLLHAMNVTNDKYTVKYDDLYDKEVLSKDKINNKNTTHKK